MVSVYSIWFSSCNSRPEVITPEIYIFYDFIYLFFGKKGREGERDEEKHQCVVASPASPTGHLVFNPGMCPDWESNWWPFGSQAHTQYTELHQPDQPEIFQCIRSNKSFTFFFGKTSLLCYSSSSITYWLINTEMLLWDVCRDFFASHLYLIFMFLIFF